MILQNESLLGHKICRRLIWMADVPRGTQDTQHAPWQAQPNAQLTSSASSSCEVRASLFLRLGGEPVSEGVCTLDSKFLTRR